MLLALAGCSSIDVHTDHDPSADFSQYRTYDWEPVEPGHEASDLSGVPNPLLEKRIRSAVEAQLAEKGLRKAGAEAAPDLLVRSRVVQRQRLESTGSHVGLGLGFGRGYWGAGVAGYPGGVETRQYTEGTLVLDFIDSRTNHLVWRGIATDTVGPPEDSQEDVSEAVAETLEKYPPSRDS